MLGFRWIRTGVVIVLSCACGIAFAGTEGGSKGETKGEPPECTLTDIDLLTPADQSKWYLSEGAVGLDASLLAVVDCAEDVYSVAFFVKPGDGPQIPVGAVDTEMPYEARLQSFFAPPVGQELVWTAEARRVTAPNVLLRTQTTVSLVATAPSDADADGLPDDAFSVLANSDDRWMSNLSMSGEDEQVVTWMRALRGNDASELPDSITAELTSPERAGQKLTLVFDRALLEGSQRAILVARFASTLAALVGSDEAAQFSREPGGDLDGEAQYVAVSVLVSSNSGETFDDISATRLGSRPIRYTLSGLELESGLTYTLARHPADFAETDEKLKLLASSGAWQSISTQQVDVAAGVITGSLTATGVYAPYFIVSDDETCPFGFCASSSLIVQLLAAAALFVLQLVPGDVGGGESPCFIATAAYGTPWAADLDVLRHVRDEWLLSNALGTAFTDSYYRVSPAIADMVAARPVVAAGVRVLLMPVVFIAEHDWGVMVLILSGGVVLIGRRRLRARVW